jgi:hypothetical protein
VASRALRAWLLATALLGAGCQHLPGRPRAVPECPGEPVSTEALGDDFLVRQRLVVAHGDRVFALDLVAQKRGDELLLLGFHPLGAQLFTLRQRGLETSIDAAPAPALEVPPVNALRDFLRARALDHETGSRVTIERDECGYRAELTTLSEQALP